MHACAGPARESRDGAGHSHVHALIHDQSAPGLQSLVHLGQHGEGVVAAVKDTHGNHRVVLIRGGQVLKVLQKR